MNVSTIALVDSCYAAANGDIEWRHALEHLAEQTDAPLLLTTSGKGHHAPPLCVGARIGAAWMQDYEKRFADRNPCTALVKGLPVGSRRTFATVSERAVLERDPFYSGWMAPQGFSAAAATIFLVDEGPDLGHIVLTRHGPTPDPTEVREEDVLVHVLRHLRRALQLWGRLRRASFVESVTDETLNRLPVAVLTLDRDGRCQNANAQACAILGGCGHGGAAPGCAANCSKATDFARRLPASGHATSTGKARDAKGSWYEYVVTGDQESDLRTVFMFPNGERRLPSPEMLRRRYAFTDREGEIALALLDGLAPGQIAEQYGIALPTVRTHVRHLLEKTGTARQTDLLVLLLGDPGIALFGR